MSATLAEADPGAGADLAWLKQLFVVVVPVALWFAPLGLAPLAQHGLAITVFMVLGWIVEVTEYAIVGLIGCFLFWALGLVKIDVAFGGFSDATTWFIFAALLFGTLATNTGIAARIANAVMRRVRPTYSGLLFGLVVTSFLLTFIVPTGTSRVAIMATITIGLIGALGLARGSREATGMFLISTYTSALFDKSMVAGAASITARGLMEKTGGVSVAWSEWFVAYAPCDLLVIVSCWWLTLKLFPAAPGKLEGGEAYLEEQARGFGPMTGMQMRAAVLLLGAVLLWVTDFAHHIPAAVIGMGVVLVALLPRIGVLTVDDLKRVNYLPFLFVASAISMAGALSATKGLDVLTDFVFGRIGPLMDGPLMTTVVLYWSAFLYHFLLASEISMLASSIPPLMTFAKTHGLNPKVVGLIWTFAAGGKLFAYQNAVLVVGFSFGYFRGRDLIRLGLLLSLAEFIFLIPTVLFYWPLLGLK